MRDLGRVFDAFRASTGCAVAVWVEDAGKPLALLAAAPPAVEAPDHTALPRGSDPITISGPAGPQIAAFVSGPRRAWLLVGPCAPDERPERVEGYVAFLLPVVAHYLQSAMEVEHAARDLTQRWEEINLLYGISEILGRTLTLEEAASTILNEVADTVGARKGSILVHDRVTDTLQAVAVLGDTIENVPPIAVDDPDSISARTFRTQHLSSDPRPTVVCAAEMPYTRGPLLSVPIMWTAPDGAQPLGVVNLSDRRGGQAFVSGDNMLVAAIATQIGTAIQNTRLVRASLAQQRFVHEMELAHDLQMKLLPSVRVVAPNADVAARVVPAESVGGDFYHLFNLGPDRTGVMIGDVSSHGYRAALIMALAMSASAIHAQGTIDPAETLHAILASLGEELSTTEMFITAFYGVIDRRAGTLRYANTGHPHAFLLDGAGNLERMPALDPPLGMVDTTPRAETRPWVSGESLLLLFTDGISDARNRTDVRLGEEPVLDVVRAHHTESPARIAEAVFGVLDEHTRDAPLLDDLTLVVVRS